MHTVGLKSDGTVVAVGDNENGQCDVSGWTDIIQVAAGSVTRWGLRLMALWSPWETTKKQCDVGGWTDIVQVAAGDLSHGGA